MGENIAEPIRLKEGLVVRIREDADLSIRDEKGRLIMSREHLRGCKVRIKKIKEMGSDPEKGRHLIVTDNIVHVLIYSIHEGDIILETSSGQQ